MDDWLGLQAEALTGSWDSSMKTHYPQHWPIWSDPQKHVEALTKRWNLRPAAELIDWSALLREDSIVLDIGAGTGWLSALLSRLPGVARVDALDASRFNLEFMLPRVTELLGAATAKIRPIHGLFTPLLREDDYYDLVVASSAFHHAQDLVRLLKECHRVLKPGAKLVILNETPLTRLAYVRRSARLFLSIVRGIVESRFVETVPTLSMFGIMYDPFLGDIVYADYHWRRAIEGVGFRFRRLDTGLNVYKPHPENHRGSASLVHFVCEKQAGRGQAVREGAR